jgi:predicted permease
MANQILSLLGALTVAFTVILLGFVSSKAGYVTKDAGRGIGQLVGKIALPCLLFRAVATTQLDTVDMHVVITVAIAKLVALALASSVGYLKHLRDPDNLTIAGVFGLFVTNSNDLAIGIPLVEALYPLKDYPNGPNVTYIYVFAVMQNVLVAPVYFVLLELGRAKTSGGEGSIIKRVLQSFLRNPLIIMAMSGLVYNLAFGASLPKVIDDIFILLGNAFACGALFSTGEWAPSAVTTPTSIRSLTRACRLLRLDLIHRHISVGSRP